MLVGNDARPRVADFGLARAQATAEPPISASPSNSNQVLLTSLTAAGALVGTPAYMSPEQYRSDPLDSRSDQFSFCAALYEALYRQLPFAGTDLADLSVKILNGKVSAVPKESPVPPLIEQVLRRGMSLDPAQRFPSMAELLAALVIDPRHDPAGAPRPRRLFSIVVLIALAFLVGGLALRHNMHKNASGVELLTVSGFMLLVVLGVGWALRRSLRQNSFHRGMARLVLLATMQMVVVRLVALITGLSITQTIALDFAALFTVGALIAWDYAPALWPVPIGYIISAVLAARYPDLALPLASVFLPGSALIFIVAWNRAVRRRAQGAVTSKRSSATSP